MATVNLTPNREADEYVEVSLEAVEADTGYDDPADNVAAGLAITASFDGEELLDVFETNADAIREFRDKVVAECDKALAHIGG